MYAKTVFSTITQGGLKMLKKDIILNNTRCLLNEYINPIIQKADKPRKKFLRQSIGAILVLGSLLVTEFSRFIHDDCSYIFYRMKCLLNHLVSPRGDLTDALRAYRESVLTYIQPDTPITVDPTDIAKPRARKMKYLAQIRNGSEDRLVNGYWCVEVYAHLKKKRIFPLTLGVYSIDDPAVDSQSLQIARTVKAVNKALKGEGIWIADRGFDGLNVYETLFPLNCNFVVRQCEDRCVCTPNGVRIIERDLVERLRQRRAQENLPNNIIFSKVYLSDNPRPLYMVASWQPGKEGPLILLTTMVVENTEQAKQIIWYYKQRWVCEEAGQFLKSRVGLERFRICRYETIQRLAILAMFAMGFLSWILIRRYQMSKRFYLFTSRFRKTTKFVYYRLLDGLQEFARLKQIRFGKTLMEPFKTGNRAKFQGCILRFFSNTQQKVDYFLHECHAIIDGSKCDSIKQVRIHWPIPVQSKKIKKSPIFSCQGDTVLVY
jgi:hypothetical protein